MNEISIRDEAVNYFFETIDHLFSTCRIHLPVYVD